MGDVNGVNGALSLGYEPKARILDCTTLKKYYREAYTIEPPLAYVSIGGSPYDFFRTNPNTS